MNLDQHMTVVGAEAADRLFDLPTDHGPFYVIDITGQILIKGLGCAAGSSTGVVDYDIAFDREKPRPKAAQFCIEATAGAPSSDEGVLDDVLGDIRVIQRPTSKSE